MKSITFHSCLVSKINASFPAILLHADEMYLNVPPLLLHISGICVFIISEWALFEFSLNSKPELTQLAQLARFTQLVQLTHFVQFDKKIQVTDGNFTTRRNVLVCSNLTIIRNITTKGI